MKRIGAIIAVVILSTLAVLLIFRFNQPNAEFTTASPNNTYRVYMKDRELENVNHVVRLNVMKNEKQIIENEVFYSGSSQYLGAEPKHTWVAENVLRFGSIDTVPSSLPDEVSVVNQTDRLVRFLKVTAGNDFLILEVQPQTTTRLFARPQIDKTSSLSWIGGYVKFDGSDMSQWGRNFTIEGKVTSPAHYCVIIKEEGVVVQSKELDSYEGVESGKIVQEPVMKDPFCQ